MKNLKMRQQSAMESGKCSRESENKGLLKKYPLLGLTGLLLWTATAWGQQPFGDNISGDATACVANSYHAHGSTKHGYDLTGKKASSCKQVGSANAASGAQIGPPVVNGSAAAKSRIAGASGEGSAISYDTAILTPPQGFQGDSVKVMLESAYQFAASSTGVGVAGYSICWTISDITEHCVEASTGHGKPKLRLGFNVPGSGSSFQFRLTIDGDATSVINGLASFKTFDVELVLPAGWTYSWASDPNRYGHSSSSQPE